MGISFAQLGAHPFCWRRRPDARSGGGIGVWDIEEKSVGEDATRPREGEVAGGQLLLIDHQLGKPPRAEPQSFEAELQRVFKEPVLQLEVLRGKERAFGPDDRLKTLHVMPGGNNNKYGGEKQREGDSGAALLLSFG